jgi:hypothetical protein
MFHALLPGACNLLQPCLQRFSRERFLFRQLQDSGSQDVEIMHFAEAILQTLQIALPSGVQLRQESLQSVAKVFDRDAQLMSRHLASGPLPAPLQIACVRQAL